jgi:uncharacterized protein with HEPN domain
MTRRDDRVPIRHALDAARRAIASTAEWRRSDLDLEELPTLGLIRLLEVIGEAANAVSPEMQQQRPEIPWRRMTGLRNRLIHGYFNVNLDIVWETVREDLPPLVERLARLLDDLERTSE